MKKTLFALALAAALPLSAQAAEPTTGLSYTWLEGDYIDVEGGNGWGLIFCNRVMQSFGGSITVTSEPGQSTVIALNFPVLKKD